MKQLLETIWNFVRKIPNGVTKFIQHKNNGKKMEIVSPIERLKDGKQHKQRRKRKSFKSFVKEDDPSVEPGQKPFSKRKKSTKRVSSNNQQMISSSDLDGENEISSNRIQGGKKKTRPWLMQVDSSVECQAIFEDNNGIEISMIDQRRINEESEIKQSDSEVQLIKLISGDKDLDNEKISPQRPQQIKFQDRFKKREKIEWWQKIIEGKAPTYSCRKDFVQNQSNNSRQFSDIANSLSSVQISRKSQWKGQPTTQKQTIKQTSIRVINLIDLVSDEDFPKLYQIPLSVKVYD